MSRALAEVVCDHAGMATSTLTSDVHADGGGPDRPLGSDRPLGGDEPAISLDGFRRYTSSSLTGAPAVLLLLPLLAGQAPLPPAPIGILTWAATLAVLATLIPVVGDLLRPFHERRRTPRQRRQLLAGGFAAAVMLMAVWLSVGDTLLWAFAPAMVASIAVIDLPRHRRRVAIATSVLVAAVVAGAVTAVRGLDQTVPLLVTGPAVTAFAMFLTLATWWTWDIVAQLDRSRRQAAALAVANERLRFAADLHDIQGHHLQVIALKSELAARLAHADPDAAAGEMDAVRGLAVDALADTRAVVQGYRRTSLDAELHNARAVLTSAGIDARLHLDAAPDGAPGGLAVSDQARHLLGLVVREAVTNVLRHSDATWAELTVTVDETLVLAVANDGAGTGPVGRDGGLADLHDRLTAAGGALTTRLEAGVFRVEASVPTDVAVGPAT